MAIAGRWNAVLKSPMGPLDVVLDITESQDGRLEGTAHNDRQTMAIEDGRFEANGFSWVFRTTGAMSMTLEVTGAVDGDSLEGTVKVGNRGKFPLVGERAA